MRGTAFLLATLCILFGGCSPTNDVVSKGPIQKRKFRPGWHVDLPVGQDLGPRAESPARPQGRALAMRPLAYQRARPETPALLASRTNTAPTAPVVRTPERAAEAVPTLAPASTTAAGAEVHAETEAERGGPRRWNRMALISGVFLLLSFLVMILGGGDVLLYLLLFALLTGIIGLILAAKHNERGKGIAIASIIIPALFIALIIATFSELWG